MDRDDLQELLDCLSKERTLFSYCHDYYAVRLLRMAASRYRSIQALKQSRFGRLLDKPSIRPLINGCGDGRFDADAFGGYWQDPGTTFLLTTGRWGSRSSRFAQTSRPGFNLVLRVNFNHQHDRLYRGTIRPKRDGAFNGWGHPKLERGERTYYRETLAWARLDVDLDQGEVLIEEIQSDWVRSVNRLSQRLSRCGADEDLIDDWRIKTTAAQARRYVRFAEPLMRDWSQATLAATIDFVYWELGIGQIWYHTWETGACLKRIDTRHGPPRSLYNRLPRQFCFEQTEALPAFLNDKRTERRLRRAGVMPRFYKLEI